MTLATLPTKARRHRWTDDDDPRAVIDPKSGNAIRKRECALCGMTRITVIPPQGFPWHEWKMKNGKVWVGETTPPCLNGTEEGLSG